MFLLFGVAVSVVESEGSLTLTRHAQIVQRVFMRGSALGGIGRGIETGSGIPAQGELRAESTGTAEILEVASLRVQAPK